MKINYNDLVLNKNIQYFHNPFGGIDDEELIEVMDPKYSFEELTNTLNQNKPIIIQFVGKKGRGKTTHLRALHQLISNSKIYFLDRNGYRNITNPGNLNIFIDSVHHIPLRKRLQLWRQANTSYVITTHWFRNLELYLCNRTYKTFHFKGVTLEKLEKILKKRISQYSSLEQNEVIIDKKVLQILLKQFGDNIRGVLNFLYDCFKVEFYGY
ncbi:hypothetical protein D1818_11775 [Aquimarina sp. BL5]|uniref:hypothetical protein n=1 Tax=Aquimarina sp. BL5 TaxID=1714860 RepID=UPI000E544E3D|nr:hypothetical protein [Aquimarina sp. BL5]AXT51479.1 hypothetical protein D1818_11775 [Aquimarina sp. BL5]RKN03022.1 hypothetical protein D7036_15015 [Aquimarina sp. BL5]